MSDLPLVNPEKPPFAKSENACPHVLCIPSGAAGGSAGAAGVAGVAAGAAASAITLSAKATLAFGLNFLYL